jgi:hypothetical protein
MTLFIRGALAAILCALLMPIGNSYAQYGAYPCPNGPGPGERVVGQTPAGNGVGSVLLCGPDGSGQSAPQQSQGPAPSYSRSNRYVAIATHADANDVWAITDIRNEEEAHAIILERCTQVMGNGCQVVVSARNAAIAVSRDRTGILWADWGETPKKAEERVTTYCATGKATPCKLMHSFKATPGFAFEGVPEIDLRKSYSPNPDTVRNIYGVSAWVDGPASEPSDTMVWFSTGKQNVDTAANEAIEQCQKATNLKCASAARSFNGYIAIAYDSDGSTRLSAGQTKKEAEAAVSKQCKEAKKKCSNIQTVDARQPGNLVINARPAVKAK